MFSYAACRTNEAIRPTHGYECRMALLLGAEGPGLSEATLAAADRRLRIPMSGTVDSINVGSAAAVGFYALGQARS